MVVNMAGHSTASKGPWLPMEMPMPRWLRLALLVGLHLGFFTVAYFGAYLFRFDFRIPDEVRGAMWQGLAAILTIKVLVFASLKMFQGWWRYVSLYDVISLAHALAISSVIFMIVNVFWFSPESFPRSVYLLDYGLSLVLIGGARGSLRLLREVSIPRAGGHRSRPVVILGAGDAGDLIVREIAKNGRLHYEPIAFLDDDPYKQGLRIHNLPVLGPIGQLPKVVEQYDVEVVIIAMPSASKEVLRRIIDMAQGLHLEVKIMPDLPSMLTEELSLNQLREVSITDLLGREPVNLDLEAIGRFLAGRRVLVTGAGGSIGSELCRQILRFGPEELVMVDAGETPLFQIDRELKDGAFGGATLVPYVASVADQDRMAAIFARHRPEIILHAAAYKHVPLMEANPCEAVKNNVMGTQIVADLAAYHQARAFVLISTDKAVNPTSIMGATKRVTELYLHDLQRRHKDTKFCAVRFGNVLGSNGSVVPIFREQIKRGGPVTVTHPEMTRYFMTIPEAVQLVLQASAFDESKGQLFILDMGQPVKIADLARDLIRLSGASEEQIPIVFTGVRPGEKLFEELTLEQEEVDRTSHAKIFIGKNAEGTTGGEFRRHYRALLAAAFDGREREVRTLLHHLIPTYHHPDVVSNIVPFEPGKATG
jgi:FlaA1/EpsC-like NDP-sugar epimerase